MLVCTADKWPCYLSHFLASLLYNNWEVKTFIGFIIGGKRCLGRHFVNDCIHFVWMQQRMRPPLETKCCIVAYIVYAKKYAHDSCFVMFWYDQVMEDVTNILQGYFTGAVTQMSDKMSIICIEKKSDPTITWLNWGKSLTKSSRLVCICIPLMILITC